MRAIGWVLISVAFLAMLFVYGMAGGFPEMLIAVSIVCGLMGGAWLIGRD